MKRFTFPIAKSISTLLLCYMFFGSNLTMQAQPDQTFRDVHAQALEFGVHVVQEGESLYEIAKKYRMTVVDLMRMNHLSGPAIFPNDQLKYKPFDQIRPSGDPLSPQNPNVIQGNIPVIGPPQSAGTIVTRNRNLSPAVPIVTSSTSRTLANANERPKTYSVKKGDNLYRIADNYGVSVDQLRAWNGISGTLIQPGEELVVGFFSDLDPFQPAEPFQDGSAIAYYDPPLVRQNNAIPTITVPGGTRSGFKNPNEAEQDWIVLGNNSTNPNPITPPSKFRSEASNVPPTPTGRTEEWGSYVTYNAWDSEGHQFYGLHPSLPSGSKIQLAIPNHPGYVEVHILGQLRRRPNDKEIVALSPAIIDIIKRSGSPQEVKIVY